MSMETAELMSIVAASGGASGVATWAAMKVKLDWLRSDVDSLKAKSSDTRGQILKLWEAVKSHSHT
jgi:hypothetical protein